MLLPAGNCVTEIGSYFCKLRQQAANFFFILGHGQQQKGQQQQLFWWAAAHSGKNVDAKE
jgi:hypothetical protein